MRLLTYYIAVGEKYKELCKASIELLPAVGDLLVITDSPWDGFCRFADKRIVEPKHLKAHIGDYVSLHNYDAVLYLDCDVVVRKPVTKLLQSIDKLWIQKGVSVVEGYKSVPTPSWAARLTDFCTGLFAFPVCDKYIRLMGQWRGMCKLYGGCDQPAFHAAWYENNYTEQDYAWMPDAAYYQGGHHDETFVHFCGDKQRFQGKYVRDQIKMRLKQGAK